MKHLIYITLLMFNISCVKTTAKTEQPVYRLKISEQEELIFLNYNKEFKLYSKPRLSKNGVISKIEGYGDEYENTTYTGIYSIDIKISENKHYVKMDAISKGYVEL